MSAGKDHAPCVESPGGRDSWQRCPQVTPVARGLSPRTNCRGTRFIGEAKRIDTDRGRSGLAIEAPCKDHSYCWFHKPAKYSRRSHSCRGGALARRMVSPVGSVTRPSCPVTSSYDDASQYSARPWLSDASRMGTPCSDLADVA